MTKKERLEIIRRIEEKRGSHVLAYVFSDRLNVAPKHVPQVVRQMYDLLCGFKPIDKKKGLDLFLYGGAGDGALSWEIVATIRELFKRFHVIVPYKAHGAAGMIALGADTIIMGEKGELRPPEVAVSESSNSKRPTLEGPMPVSVEDVNAFFSLLERMGKLREKQRTDAFLQAMDKLSPLLLGSINRAFEENKSIALRLLETRRKSFRKGTNHKIVNTLFPDYLAPRCSISRSEALSKIGLRQVKAMGELEGMAWDLFTSYEKEMEMETPFYPEDVMGPSEDEERVFPDHKVIYLETTKETRVFQIDMKVKRVRQIPPSIEFNPQISLPTIQAPEIQEAPEDLLDFIRGWLQGNLPKIIYDCFDRLRKDFPVVAYEQMRFNRRWVSE